MCQYILTEHNGLNIYLNVNQILHIVHEKDKPFCIVFFNDPTSDKDLMNAAFKITPDKLIMKLQSDHFVEELEELEEYRVMV